MNCRIHIRIFFLIIFSTFLLSGCQNRYILTMMPDGNTWEIKYREYSECGGVWHSNDDCQKNMMPAVIEKATETCADKPYRIFNCGMINDYRQVSCFFQCKDMTTIRTIDQTRSVINAPSMTQPELMEKAKKCQAKGGYWINDTCQLPTD